MPATPVSEKDYLQQDPAIRGQNYACLSFVSPEDVIERKEQFFFRSFVKGFSESAAEALALAESKASAELAEEIAKLRAQYSYVFDPDAIGQAFEKFCGDNEEAMTRDFDAANEFRTSVRGIKVRGCYDTLDEAKNRAEQLIKHDPKFHVFIGEVGCWCPWSPNPDAIKEETYAETQLNTLVKEYKENIENRDAEYAKRKNDMTELAIKEGRSAGEGSGGGGAGGGGEGAAREIEEVITVGGVDSKGKRPV